MIMITCKECRYWIEGEKKGYKTCYSPDHLQGYYHHLKDLKSNQILIENDEGWGLYTGSDFGCVNGKLKVCMEKEKK